ncbi:hypothetical protein [Streptomyces sp. SID3343]|uniref:hypothetical protein n=1 Tax=Streptomyces sp. SID3343 TaxID=2690260 RepID=UPI00136C25A0|nr:hypothetical protein [Streptomyces sp. SID3343]MYW00898.1 hypothetical protein [Streptomyces sp. SID3343]
MADRENIDRVLSPWLYENAAASPVVAEGQAQPPLETRLQSTIDPGGGGGTVRLDAATLYASASRLDGLRGEIEGDTRVALQGADHNAVGRNLEVAKAVQYVHDRWAEKLAHLVEDMQERVTRVRKAADRWGETEADIKRSFE